MRSSKAFTMIELVFVIVVLGILASIAIPKLAATRDDAEITSLKAIVKQAQSALPAYYTGQHVASFKGAMILETSNNPAAKNVFAFSDASECTAVYQDKSGDRLTMQIVNNVADAPIAACTEGTRAVDSNLSLLITYTYVNDDIVAQVGKLSNKINGATNRFPLGGVEVER